MAALILGAILGASVPTIAHAAQPEVSQGEGRLLTAELLNSGIDSLVALNGASAIDQYGLGDVTSDVPLDATALSLLNLKVNSINLFGTAASFSSAPSGSTPEPMTTPPLWRSREP
ncbi:MAG: hypothetical protein ABIP33_10505 [Pseudolysinimonas sp.]